MAIRRNGRVTEATPRAAEPGGEATQQFAGVSETFGEATEKFGEATEKFGEVTEKITEVTEKITEVTEKITEVTQKFAEVTQGAQFSIEPTGFSGPFGEFPGGFTLGLGGFSRPTVDLTDFLPGASDPLCDLVGRLCGFDGFLGDFSEFLSDFSEFLCGFVRPFAWFRGNYVASPRFCGTWPPNLRCFTGKFCVASREVTLGVTGRTLPPLGCARPGTVGVLAGAFRLNKEEARAERADLPLLLRSQGRGLGGSDRRQKGVYRLTQAKTVPVFETPSPIWHPGSENGRKLLDNQRFASRLGEQKRKTDPRKASVCREVPKIALATP